MPAPARIQPFLDALGACLVLAALGAFDLMRERQRLQERARSDTATIATLLEAHRRQRLRRIEGPMADAEACIDDLGQGRPDLVDRVAVESQPLALLSSDRLISSVVWLDLDRRPLAQTCGAAVAADRARQGTGRQAMVLSIGVRAVCIPQFLLCPGPWSLGLMYAVASLFGPLYDVVQFSYRIALVLDGLKGRVNSSFRLFAFLLNPVGAALCGWLLERGGSPPAVAVFGGATVLLALAARLDPAIRQAKAT